MELHHPSKTKWRDTSSAHSATLDGQYVSILVVEEGEGK